MTTYRLHERKRRTKLWILLILLTAGTLALSYWLTWNTSPPRKIILATGPRDGSYYRFGEEYRKRLTELGLEVELIETNGSIDNMKRLVQRKVDVGFVQGGTHNWVKDDKHVLRGLVALYREPLWVFCRLDALVRFLKEKAGKGYSLKELFQDQRIGIGPKGSGTEVLAEQMLRMNGITDKDVKRYNLSMYGAKQQLVSGKLDIAFFIATGQEAEIQELMRAPGIQLLPFQRHKDAYTRPLPYLKAITLTEGSIDLETNIPKVETTLLAPAAMLACRKDLNPRVIELILKVAYEIHAPGSLVDAPNKFPTLDGVDLPTDETAVAYVKTGQSLLSRLLPYWAVRQVFQLRVLILPLLLVWLPYLKILPMLYHFRINRLLRRHYGALRDVESAIAQVRTAEELREPLKELENLRTNMEKLSRKIPGHLQDKVYQWRLHVAMVHDEAVERVRRLEANSGMVPN